MDDIKSFSSEELVLRMEKLVRTERKITHLVLLYICEIEERKLYADLGYDGMYAYLTKGLGYSDGSAYRRLQSARLLKKIPSVAEKIEEGSLNLTQLTQVQKCLQMSSQNMQRPSKDAVALGNNSDVSKENVSIEKVSALLSKIENKNSFETQKTLATEMDLPIQSHEKIRPQKDDSVRIELTLTAEQFAELEMAKSLLSHICPQATWAEVISMVVSKYNKSKLEGRGKLSGESVSSSKFQQVDASNSTAVATTLAVAKEKNNGNGRTSRKYISLEKRRYLLKKARYCCEYRDHQTGTRCRSQFQLEIDHCKPVAFGGTDELKNLRILCRTHNAQMARKMGLSFK